LSKKNNGVDPYIILDYYKEWDSNSAPVMMMEEDINEVPGEIESEDEKRLIYLWNKYKKSSK
jgi:hypothetical protein